MCAAHATSLINTHLVHNDSNQVEEADNGAHLEQERSPCGLDHNTLPVRQQYGTLEGAHGQARWGAVAHRLGGCQSDGVVGRMRWTVDRDVDSQVSQVHTS